MKCQCGSTKLKAYNHVNLDYIYSLVQGEWILSNPLLSFFHATKYPFEINCLTCGHFWKHQGVLKPQVSPAIKHREITLDLDQTLFYIKYTKNPSEKFPEADFSWFEDRNKYYYYLFKRPGLDKFIQEITNRFDKINIFTAATMPYAQKAISYLNLPPDKMGFLKTINDTVLMRGLRFDREYMKFNDNSLIVEDRPEVIDGFNNTILQVTPYSPQQQDQELLKLISLFNKSQNDLPQPEKISGRIRLFLKNKDLHFKNLPWDKIQDLLSIPSLSQEELNLLPSRTSSYVPHFTYENHQGIFSYSDVSYDNYLKIFEIIHPYSKHRKISKRNFDLILDKLNQKRKKLFKDNF